MCFCIFNTLLKQIAYSANIRLVHIIARGRGEIFAEGEASAKNLQVRKTPFLSKPSILVLGFVGKFSLIHFFEPLQNDKIPLCSNFCQKYCVHNKQI